MNDTLSLYLEVKSNIVNRLLVLSTYTDGDDLKAYHESLEGCSINYLLDLYAAEVSSVRECEILSKLKIENVSNDVITNVFFS